MKALICFVALSLLGCVVRAQGEVEALRYSSSSLGLSARSLGMSGAYSSVGADISNFFSNPAGLALYKRSSLEFALSHDSHVSETKYQDEENKDLRSRLSIGNAAFVASRKPRSPRILNFSYGLAYSKTQQFYQDFTIEGKAETSIMQQFAWQASGVSPNELYDTYPFGAGLAYEIYGIDPADEAGTSYYAATEGEASQRKRVEREGRQNETVLGMALQYGENLYLGGTAGITGVYFSEVSNYTEKYSAGKRVRSIAYDEDLSTYGTGFVARLGAIYRIHETIKVSAAYQTKTTTYFQDYYSTSASSSVDTMSYYSSSPELVAEYILRSPSQWTFGVSSLVGKLGMISLDWSQSDYRKISMNGTDENNYAYTAENELFNTLFRRTNQLRLGAEARLHSTYYARAGYSINQSPLSDESLSLNDVSKGWSFGVGYRDDHLFADMACSSTQQKNSYYLYDPALVDEAIVADRQVRVLLSVGVRF